MTVHTFHPDSHKHGLADGCPRCAEHAEDPLASLDAENIAVLRLMIQIGVPPRSNNEARAMARIQAAPSRSYEDDWR